MNKKDSTRILYFFSFSLIISYFFSACHHNYPGEDKSQQLKEHVMDVNRNMVHDEAKNIETFISRHQWKMQTTGDGLRIEVYEEGKGSHANSKSTVTIAYKVYLLDGTLCYSADEKHPLKFSPGNNEQPRGLEEGLMMMNEGSKARMILPAHLACGMTGDGNKISPGNALYYEVQLLKVESH